LIDNSLKKFNSFTVIVVSGVSFSGIAVHGSYALGICCEFSVFLLPPYVIGQAIIFSSCGFFFLSFFFSSPNLSRRTLDVYHTSTHGVALVWIWNAGLAGNTGCKKSPKICYLGTIAQLCRAVSSQLRHVSTIGKKFVKQQYFLHMSPQYGELTSH